MTKKQQICILGSTGSIGTQALEVIEEHADRYEVYCLTANNRVKELAAQARKFKPAAVVIANEQHYAQLTELLADLPDIKVYAGARAIDEIVEAGPIDMVLTAMVGFAGLSPTIHADFRPPSTPSRQGRKSAWPTRRPLLSPANSSASWPPNTMLPSSPSIASTPPSSKVLWARTTTR